MSIDETIMLDLEIRNLALNELLERTIQGLPVNLEEMRKTLKLHYLRKLLTMGEVPAHDQPQYIGRLVQDNPQETLDLSPELREWVSNQQYHPRNIVAVVTRGLSWSSKGRYGQVPSASEPEDLELMDRMIKAMVELHPVSMDGLNTGFGSHGLSVNQQKASFNVIEKYGRVFDKLLHRWHDDYNNWHSLNCKEMPDTPVIESVTIDMIFFEPDPTHSQIVHAWKGTNLHPFYYSGIRSRRDISGRGYGEIESLDFNLAGTYTMGSEVHAEAQTVLDGLVLADSNPYTQAEFVGKISDDVLNFTLDRP